MCTNYRVLNELASLPSCPTLARLERESKLNENNEK